MTKDVYFKIMEIFLSERALFTFPSTDSRPKC